ncbi:hypothetical protein FH972_016469 [Carpinus fangiana]|uniref:Uncharacterized protein n=1 Tax=Carpinus fangiana TaxID=176857 RepID=A0A5N6RG85_9ROSI|nr:hypothetical protein FH972_016469 [Carpinus fangiana]
MDPDAPFSPPWRQGLMNLKPIPLPVLPVMIASQQQPFLLVGNGLVVGVPTYHLAGSLVDLGMAWWQGIATYSCCCQCYPVGPINPDI